jgi:tetratricopeptide (TPR) repeat protein
MAGDEVLPGWLHALGVDPAAIPGPLDSRVTVWRAAVDGKRMLIVLDNARDEDQIRSLLPGTPTCSVLITSRQRLPGLAIHHGAQAVRLDPLPLEDGIMLVRHALGDPAVREPAAIAELVDLCGRLPLALKIVAETAVERAGASLDSLVDELRDERARLRVLHGDDARSDPRTVFSWSYRQLRPDLASAFRALGLFAGRDLCAEALAALMAAPVATARTHLRDLARLNLVHNDQPDRIQTHDLIRLYATELAEHEESAENIAAARRRLYSYYLLSTHRADTRIEPLRYHVEVSTADVDVPVAEFGSRSEALAWFEAERANIVALCAMDLEALDEARWKLAFLARGYFFLAKRIHEWLTSHRYALDATIRIGDAHAEAMTRSNLGVALHENGQDDAALPQFEKAGALFADVGDWHGVSNTLAHRAALLRRAGEFAGSLKLSREALQWYRSVGNQRNVAITLRAIGLAEWENGHADEAEPALLQSVQLCRELGLDMDEARSCNTLGQLYLAAARLPESGRFFRAAMDAGEQSGAVFEKAIATRGLGALAAATGDTEQAEALCVSGAQIGPSMTSRNTRSPRAVRESYSTAAAASSSDL